MVRKKKPVYTKIINERYPLSRKRGGGVIKIEAWEDEKGNIGKYNIAYINTLLYQNDNGIVIDYDNAHNYHHKYCLGEVLPVDDFISYEDIIERFENDIKEYIK
ncbi:MAG: transcriptional regulator [Gammaproteobacteria bacterium]|nr:MAG: transcriptional regulator [Gammaproteobacteria bacterium]